MEWRHNAQKKRWELGTWDIDHNEFNVISVIIDEIIADEQLAAGLAEELEGTFGSIPPPMQELLDEKRKAS